MRSRFPTHMRRWFSKGIQSLAIALLAWIAWSPTSVLAQSSVPAPGPCDTGSSSNASCRMHLVFSTTVQATRSLTVAPSADFALLPASGRLEAADYDAGSFDAAGRLTVTVSSTAAWRLTIQASAGSMTGACAMRPASSIQWGVTPTTRTAPLSTTPSVVASGSSYAVNRAVDVFLRVSLDWLRDGPVAAANCTLPLAFTVSAP